MNYLIYLNLKGEEMEHLSDDCLLDVYQKAQEIQLGDDFIRLIEEEIKRRGLNLR